MLEYLNERYCSSSSLREIIDVRIDGQGEEEREGGGEGLQPIMRGDN